MGTIFSACHKDSAEPAYLQINPFTLTTDKTTQGSNSSRITDVWVFVNQQPVGAYSLPCKIPVIATGNQQVILAPGILKDASLIKRTSYAFYTSVFDTINFEKGKTYTFNPSIKYNSALNFIYKEDFELGSSLIKRFGDTSIIRNNDAANITENYLDNYVGKITLDAQHDTMQAISNTLLPISTSGNKAFIELDYKCDYQFTIGLLVTSPSNVFEYWHLTLKPKSIWNKAYLDISDEINRSETGSKFQLMITAGSTKGDLIATQNIYIDNLKIISQK
ncbi:MAG: hypothetical protein RIQ33_2285 [Bacteroidota bacterium]|jgi:hypothetical protein